MATRAIIGLPVSSVTVCFQTLECVRVKVPQFSFSRLYLLMGMAAGNLLTLPHGNPPSNRHSNSIASSLSIAVYLIQKKIDLLPLRQNR